MNTITLHIGDVRDVMNTLPDASIDFGCTSPPFLALRSYLPADHPDKHREIGSEATPAAYLDTLLELTQVWRRLLTPTGSLCVELGDTYAGNDNSPSTTPNPAYGTNGARFNERAVGGSPRRDISRGWPLPKSLCGIPTLYAWSLAYGRNLLNPATTFDPWRIRNLLTWTRPNPPVGALGDKFRPATSFVTVACTNDKRWFDLDAVRVPGERINEVWPTRISDPRDDRTWKPPSPQNPAGAPPLDWWQDDWQPLHNLPTHPYKGAHYATYPPALPRRLIEAMCPREVCQVCGEARRRIVGEAEYVSTNGGRVVNQWAGDRRGAAVNQWTVEGGNPGHAVKTAPTLGWTDCGCPLRADAIGPPYDYAHNYHPGLTFDPFAGSGTTAIAAAQTGRDCVMIDLDMRSVDLIRQRLTETMRIIDEHNDGTTWTWTVTPATRLEVAAINAGQLTFDLTA